MENIVKNFFKIMLLMVIKEFSKILNCNNFGISMCLYSGFLSV